MSEHFYPRLAWLLGGLTLTLLLVWALLLASHITVPGAAPYEYWKENLLTALVYTALGVLIANRQPWHPIGWLFVVIGLSSGVQICLGEYAAAALDTERLPGDSLAAWLSQLVQISSLLLIVFALLLFPTGRLISARWRPVAWLAVLGTTLALLGNSLLPGPIQYLTVTAFTNPFGMDSAIPGALTVAGGVVFIAAAFGAVLSLILRLFRSRGEERQQLKWFVVVAVVGSATLFGVSVLFPRLMNGEMGSLLWTFAGTAPAVAVGLAILRYRLYDIDVVINRTLVYVVLTASLVLVYVGSVVLLQQVFRTLTGGESQLAVVASTLAIAALFNPLRRRIQNFIDRIFYRGKYDSARILASFGARLRNETELDRLNNDLVSVVRETMQPAYVSLWLRDPEDHL